jgi:hypothetical protein
VVALDDEAVADAGLVAVGRCQWTAHATIIASRT